MRITPPPAKFAAMLLPLLPCHPAIAAGPPLAGQSTPASLGEALQYWSGSSVDYAFPAPSQFRRFNLTVMIEVGGTRMLVVASRQGRQFRMLTVTRIFATYVAFGGGPRHAGRGEGPANPHPMPRNCVAAVFTPGTRYIGVIKTHGSPVCLWDYYDRALKTSAVGFGGWQKPGAQACTILLGPQLFDSLARHGRKFRFDPRTGTISVEGFHKRHTGIFRTRFVVIHRSSGKREVVPVSVGFSIYGPVGRLLKFEREWVVLNPRVPLLPEKRFWRQSRLPGLKIRKVNYHFFYKSCTPAPDPRGKVGVHAVARERRFTDWAVGKKHGQRIIRWVNGGLWKSGPASTFGGAAK